MSGAHDTGKGDRDRTKDREAFKRRRALVKGYTPEVNPGRWRVVGGEVIRVEEKRDDD